jgi:hypothetical protein
MKLYKAPQAIETIEGRSVFLAGSIDMGNAANWQEEVTDHFRNKNCTVLNPRRDDWDSSWKQTIEDPQFKEQVNWELDAMDKADIIIMNFLPGSQAPITLLELGLNANSGKLFVCCPQAFWRSGNVYIVCKKYNIPLFSDIKILLKTLEGSLD